MGTFKMFGRAVGAATLLALSTAATCFGQVRQNNGQNPPKTTDPDAPPLITSIFPPAAVIGKETKLAIVGVNLKTVEELLISGEGVETASFTAESETKGTVVIKAAANAEQGTREVRAAGIGGLSNLLVIQLDRLEQVVETEPNDAIGQAKPVAEGAAIVGRLTARDLDHFLIHGKKGRGVTLEVEAHRLGATVTPVLTILSPNGVALAQAHETRGLERDCRLLFRFPRDGDYVIQVRDKTYRGNEAAVYRLRIEGAPYATSMFPLGGPKGGTIKVQLAGGNLLAPIEKTVVLPDEPGASIDPGVFESPAGSVRAPGKLLVGDATNEVVEQAGPKPTPLPIGASANGRIDKKREVDRYVVSVKKGEPILLSVRAAALGSWLDSVLTLKNAKGEVVAESDDPGLDPNAMNNNPFFFNNNGQTFPVDSRIEYTPTIDGDLTAEIEDRFGDAGPEFGYRLDFGPPRSDFSIKLLLSNPAARVRAVAVNGRVPRFAPGTLGAFNLKPGATVPVNFLIESSGRTGPIEVSLEGLPPGVSSKPVTIRLAQPLKTPQSINRPNAPAGGVILVRVAKEARPSLAWMKVVATAKVANGPTIRKVAQYAAPIETGSGDNQQQNQFGIQSTPPSHSIEMLPFRVLGNPAEFMYGPPRSTTLEVREFQVAGALLQGGTVDATFLLDPGADGFKASEVQLFATPIGAGITAEVVGIEPAVSKKEGGTILPLLRATVRLHASADAAVGAAGATVKIAPIGGETIERTAIVPVWRPFSIHLAEGSRELSPGAPGSLYIGVERAPGFAGPVDLKLEPLPEGVTIVGPTRIAPEQSGLTITLNCVKPIAAPQQVTVSGVATLAHGQVRAESAIRAVLRGRAASAVK